MATAAAAAVAVARRRVLGYFFERNAVTPEHAVHFIAERRLQQRQLERFCGNGVIREAKPGTYYVDVPRWHEWQHGLHSRAKLIVLVVLIAAGVALALALTMTLTATVGRG